jgi:transcriptional regulator with XRE-family HTH domain
MNQKLKFLRETLGLTEKEISAFLNISSYKYVSFEKTAVEVPCDMLILLSRIYGVNIKLFLDNRYSNQDVLAELIKQNIIERNKEDIFEHLRRNLFCNNDTKVTYRSIRKVKTDIQNNIINSIIAIIKNNGMSSHDFEIAIDIDKQSLDSILLKKRFIGFDELIKISEKFKVSINDIING